jgi:hypothetical protein
MDEPLVVVVVLNWNGREDSAECLTSLRAVTYRPVKVLLVDNGSTDGSVEALRREFPGVELVENGRNLGFAEGSNVGIRRALALGAEYVLALNNDTTVEPDVLAKLVETARADASIGVIGPRLNRYAPRERVWFAGGHVCLWAGWTWHAGNRAKDRGQFSGVVDEDYQTGAAMMLSRLAIEKAGMFDAGYVSYFEDADLCLRARAAAFRVVCRRDAVVYHKVSASTGGGLTPAKAYRKILSGARFFRLHSGPARYYTTVAAFNVACAALTALGKLLTGKPAVAGAICRGFFDLMRGRDRDAGTPP